MSTLKAKELPTIEAIGQFVESLLPIPYQGGERRKSPRRSVLIPIRTQPLDDQLNPIGEEEDSLMCNVSCHGAMFVHRRTLDARHVAIRFPDRGASQVLVMEIVRNRPVGSYFEIAGTFLCGDRGEEE